MKVAHFQLMVDQAIGLKSNSKVAGRYIDTGKQYKKLYTFTSMEIKN